MQEPADPSDDLPPEGLALPGAVWKGPAEDEDEGGEAGALEELKDGEAPSESASQNESGLVSDYSKVGTVPLVEQPETAVMMQCRW